MYTGYLDSLDNFSRDIYEISKEFKVHGLTALAREHLAKELNVGNCCDYLIFCVVNNDYELKAKVQSFIQDNYDAVMKTASYKQARRKYRELFENTFGEIFKKMSPNSILPPFASAASGCSNSTSSTSSSSSNCTNSSSSSRTSSSVNNSSSNTSNTPIAAAVLAASAFSPSTTTTTASNTSSTNNPNHHHQHHTTTSAAHFQT